MVGVFWNIFLKISAWTIVKYFDYEAVLKNYLVGEQEKQMIWKYDFAGICLRMCVGIASTVEFDVVPCLSSCTAD